MDLGSREEGRGGGGRALRETRSLAKTYHNPISFTFPILLIARGGGEERRGKEKRNLARDNWRFATKEEGKREFRNGRFSIVARQLNVVSSIYIFSCGLYRFVLFSCGEFPFRIISMIEYKIELRFCIYLCLYYSRVERRMASFLFELFPS